MPRENETDEEFHARVPNPKFRCNECYKKHIHELVRKEGNRHVVVRGRPVAGAELHTVKVLEKQVKVKNE